MSLARTLLVAGALTFVSPAIAQTTGSETCTTITQSAANAAASRINADDTDIPKPQSVKTPVDPEVRLKHAPDLLL